MDITLVILVSVQMFVIENPLYKHTLPYTNVSQ